MFKRPLGGHIYQQTTRASQKRGAQDLLGVIDMMGLVPFDRYDRDMLRACLLYTSPSPRDVEESRMPSSA